VELLRRKPGDDDRDTDDGAHFGEDGAPTDDTDPDW
jgi:hypothetical protein